jgi:gluconolactonase
MRLGSEIRLGKLGERMTMLEVPDYVGRLVPEDPRFNTLVSPDAKIEVLATGFAWSEGPIWLRDRGFLLFSDIPRNAIMKWSMEDGLSLFIKPSGYTGIAPYGKEPGSNGLTVDGLGQLVSCEHGDRRVARLDWNGGKRTLADLYEGKRLNSPNDLVYRRATGDLYFTDPPYGLPTQSDDDPRKELPFNGVYKVSADGTITLLVRDMTRPNGLAFSPDEKTLYVAQSDRAQAIWNAFPVKDDGTLGERRLFADVTELAKTLEGLPDGLKVDRAGHLFATGPGGVLVYTPDGTRLGRIETGQATANCAWGDDGSTLYITANTLLLRIKTLTKGAGW